MPNLTIIQRIQDSLKTGQYQMLLLEFVIVAAGIFIGFQVDRWYEQIQDDEITEQYIQRLLINVQNDISNLKGAANTAKSRRESTERVILSLESDRIVTENPNRYLSDLRSSTMRFQAVINDMTYLELQSTGDMSLLPVELRERLYTYYGGIGSFEQFDATRAGTQLEAFKRFAGILLPKHFDLVTSPPGVDQAALNFTNEDAMAAAERFRGNQAAIEWLGILRNLHSQEERFALRALTGAQSLEMQLEGYFP